MKTVRILLIYIYIYSTSYMCEVIGSIPCDHYTLLSISNIYLTDLDVSTWKSSSTMMRRHRNQFK